MSAVVVDRWDREDLGLALDRVELLARARARLAKRLTWGGSALDDVFFLLHKARPEVVSRDQVEGDQVAGQVLVWLLSQSPAVSRLRHQTVRDLTTAALVAAALAPRLDELACALGDAGLAGEDQQELVEQATELAGDALDAWEASASVMADQEEEQDRAGPAWGLSSGEMQRLSVPERLELSRRLNSERVRQITDLFGRLRMSMFAERAESVDAGVSPVDVTLGDSVEHMVGAELLSMLCEELFLAKVGEGSLMQYQFQGEEQVGRGGIVLCVDGSGSMGVPHQGFTREMWASALKLHLLHLAVRESRPMHVIDFGAPGQWQYQRFVDSEERTPLKLLQAAETWFGFGTDFATPLRRAVQVLADENDRSSDVVFVSDGECVLPERSRKTYERACRSRNIRTWGVQLGRKPGGLRSFCDRIFTVTDLTSGQELGALLNAVENRR